MKVYVAVTEYDYSNSDVLGVSLTADGAKSMIAADLVKWHRGDETSVEWNTTREGLEYADLGTKSGTVYVFEVQP